MLLVTDTWLDRQVTLSLLRSDDPGEAARLRREAALTAGFDASQGVVGVHDVGQVGDRPFVVTQYLEGGSVRDLLTGGRVPLRGRSRWPVTSRSLWPTCTPGGWSTGMSRPRTSG